MVALVVSLVALLGLGLLDWAPRWLEADTGVASVEPGLLTVAPEARGVAVLGDGYTVSLYKAGFRYSRDDEILADTVTRGAPVIALVGSLAPAEGQGPTSGHRERITRVLPAVTITTVDVRPGSATYLGTVSGRVDGGAAQLPLRWEVALSGGALRTTVSVPGADAVVLSLDVRPNVIGIPPQLPDRNLRRRSWWFGASAGAGPAFTWMLPSAVGLGPAGVPRVADLSVDGRIDLHVWADTAHLVLRPRALPG